MINIYKGIDKLKNKKTALIKKSKYIAVAGVLATTTLTTGCGTKIDTKYTISEVINTIKDNTLIDENLAIIKVAPAEGEEELTFAAAEEAYKTARAENNIKDCNKYIYIMSQALLCSEIASAYDVNLNETRNIRFNVNRKNASSDFIATLTYNTDEEKMVPGGIITTVDTKNKVSLVLDGNAKQLASIITKAHSEKLNLKENEDNNIDNSYEVLRNSPIGKSKVSFTFLKTPHFNIGKPSSKTIKKLKLNK